MIRAFFLLFLITSFPLFGQDSRNIELLDRWEEDSLVVLSHGLRYNECWGFEHNGNEYAVAGSTEGTHFFRITDSDKLEPVGFIEGNYSHPSVIHRDFKSYQHYIYSVCDEGLSSLQIIDISNLPNSVTLVKEDSVNFARAHNIFIDTNNAILYACTVAGSSGGTLLPSTSMRVYSLSDPLNPTHLWTGPNDIPEVHDAYVRNNIAYINCGFDGLRVYDFSNASSPLFIQNLGFYQEQGYNHQGWLSPDGTKYVFADETNGKKIKFCEVEDNEVTIRGYFGTNYEENSVPHNIMLSNRFAYVAYYNEGLRIYDMNELPPKEVAHFDTHPEEEGPFTMNGAWGIYSELSSGRVLVSDRRNGLFLFRFRDDILSAVNGNELVVFSNPSVQGNPIQFRIDNPSVEQFEYRIVDMTGKVIEEKTVVKQSYASSTTPLSVGVYQLQVNYQDYLDDTIKLFQKIMIY